MDSAVHCAALSTGSAEACTSSPYNCSTLNILSLSGGLNGLQSSLSKRFMPGGSIGERLFSLAIGQIPLIVAMGELSGGWRERGDGGCGALVGSGGG